MSHVRLPGRLHLTLRCGGEIPSAADYRQLTLHAAGLAGPAGPGLRAHHCQDLGARPSSTRGPGAWLLRPPAGSQVCPKVVSPELCAMPVKEGIYVWC